ncbi:MAG: hypothetical protein JETCAE03_34480 [Ignavibacteriaceae bacterium]|jgi:hypothetical protein|nr:MAG: hypothetical protein JETCAE03_34480 [Ignavibacteriaceae bacterium]
MKKFGFILILVSMFAMLSVAQTPQKFYCYKISVINNATEEFVDVDVSLNITLSGNSLIIHTDDVLYYTIYGEIVNSSKSSFYAYAYDQDDSKCRLWFKADTQTLCKFGIEYSDFSFLYFCKLAR